MAASNYQPPEAKKLNMSSWTTSHLRSGPDPSLPVPSPFPRELKSGARYAYSLNQVGVWVTIWKEWWKTDGKKWWEYFRYWENSWWKKSRFQGKWWNFFPLVMKKIRQKRQNPKFPKWSKWSSGCLFCLDVLFSVRKTDPKFTILHNKKLTTSERGSCERA